MKITKEAFEQFVKKEFPGKKCHWDYKDGEGYMSIQAGNGKKFSFPELHYEYYNGQVRIHIEGPQWWDLRNELSYILKKHPELRGEVWQKRQNCQWILDTDQDKIFSLFKSLRDIVEPELCAYEEGTKFATSSEESVDYEEYTSDNIYKLNLSIPLYQRIYTWQQEQVKTLLDDICEIKIDSYFIGSVILHRHGGKDQYVYDIVDGQQRLVTTALIKYALSQYEGTEIPVGINNFMSKEYASSEAQYNIKTNFEYIKDYLADDQRRKNVSENIHKLTFSVLTIKKEDDLELAFNFFSNTNSKGKRLTDYDLLKPHHLRYIPSDLEEQQMHLATKWDQMINKNRSIEAEALANQDVREYVDYIRVMEIYLFRIRNWSSYRTNDEYQDHYIKKEFESAPIISEIPPFGEKFNFDEPIQGGQHFFAFVDHFLEAYNNFRMKDKLQRYFGKYGSYSWYGSVIEALVFCYYLKFGESYINEATMSITRYISIIRFRLARAYKPTIFDWARRSKIVMDISRATSPTFFLAAIEKRIDNPPVDDGRQEDASRGVRNTFLNYCCKPLTEELMEVTSVNQYKTYYSDRYGKFSKDSK